MLAISWSDLSSSGGQMLCEGVGCETLTEM